MSEPIRIYCPECGDSNIADAATCFKCGHQLAKPSPSLIQSLAEATRRGGAADTTPTPAVEPDQQTRPPPVEIVWTVPPLSVVHRTVTRVLLSLLYYSAIGALIWAFYKDVSSR